MTDYLTQLDRFEAGDYPMVCVSSGLPADKLVPVQAERKAGDEAWLFVSVLAYIFAAWPRKNDNPWGLLPFANGHVGGIKVTYHPTRKHIVRIRGAHPSFAKATQEKQRQPKQ